MSVLIATDVFGVTPAIHSLVRSLGRKCLVVSPFDEDLPPPEYRAEHEAYQSFVAAGGVQRYAYRIREALAVSGRKIEFAVGFSAGASALWMTAATDAAADWREAVLFYGSRIRDHQDLQPKCPVHLIFAEREAAFDPRELAERLARNGHKVELAADTAHGFMNPYSGGFFVKTQQKYLEVLQQKISP
jgi:dienelactone hydrolase